MRARDVPVVAANGTERTCFWDRRYDTFADLAARKGIGVSGDNWVDSTIVQLFRLWSADGPTECLAL